MWSQMPIVSPEIFSHRWNSTSPRYPSHSLSLSEGATEVSSKPDREQLGLEVYLQHPSGEDAQRIPTGRREDGAAIYPELDGDGDHLHFEMVPMSGESLLWLTIRRGTTPALAASSLRKVASLIDRHGDRLLRLQGGNAGSFGNSGEVIDGPLRLEYDEHGDIIIPGAKDSFNARE